MNTASKSAYCVVSLSLILMLALMLEQALHAQTQPIQYYYDSLGRLVTTVDQFGNVANYSYDAVGNITQIARSTVKPGQLAIFDFNPQIGPVGISVTIQGQGFSATASSDIVKFNGVTATVTSAATKTLVATVPVGATTGPISVTLKGNTATSSTNFVVAVAPVITSLWPRSALFNTAIPNVQVTGSNLLGAIITFNDAAIPMICFSGQCITSGPQVSVTSIGPTGTTATLTITIGNYAGTFALIAANTFGNSGVGPTAANRFTVVDPGSAAISGCGVPYVVEAAYGLDPLDPNSCPTSTTQPLAGEVDPAPFSVLDTAGAKGSGAATEEADAVPFSVLDTAGGKGSQDATIEADAVPLSVLDTAGSKGSQDATIEADAAPFSVLDTAGGKGSGAATMEADGVCFSVFNDPPPPPSGLACANATLPQFQSKDGSKKGATHAAKTKPPTH